MRNEVMAIFQELESPSANEKKGIATEPWSKLSTASQWLAMEKNKTSFDTDTDSTQNSESYCWEDDVSELSYTETSFETLDLSVKPTTTLVSYWEAIAHERLELHGLHHRRTGEACFEKGRAYMENQDYDAAFCDFSLSASIFKSIHGPHHLNVARSLHHQGIAAYRSDKLSIAQSAFETAFKIRHDVLGPLHIDTVDTCGHIGSVHYKQGDLPSALRCYEEVMVANIEILGEEHLFVAETALAVARIYTEMEENDRAAETYNFALSKFEILGVQSRIAQAERELHKLINRAEF